MPSFFFSFLRVFIILFTQKIVFFLEFGVPSPLEWPFIFQSRVLIQSYLRNFILNFLNFILWFSIFSDYVNLTSQLCSYSIILTWFCLGKKAKGFICRLDVGLCWELKEKEFPFWDSKLSVGEGLRWTGEAEWRLEISGTN